MNGRDDLLAFAPRLARLQGLLPALPDKPEETAESALRALWLLAGGQPLSVEAAAAVPLCRLDEAQLAALDRLIDQRLQGVPLAHLSGRQHFMGLELLAGPQALIPRRETELLARAASNRLRELADALGRPPLVIDLCTGSGNVALALAHAEPRAQVFAADLSDQAAALAQRNVAQLGLQERVSVRTGDLLAPFDEAAFHGRVDLLVCNPPYISSGKLASMPAEIAAFEPRMAFDGGPFGIGLLQRLLREAPRYLRPGGWLALEVGLGQGPAVLQWLQRSGRYEPGQAVPDAHGQTRAVLARHQAQGAP